MPKRLAFDEAEDGYRRKASAPADLSDLPLGASIVRTPAPSAPGSDSSKRAAEAVSDPTRARSHRLVMLALVFGMTVGAARASEPEASAAAGEPTALEQFGDRAVEVAQRAILIGGVVLYNHRHAVAGAVMGCGAGAVAVGTSALAVGIATAGLAAPAAPSAAALGCGLGALGGALLGARMDDLSMP